MSKKKRTFKFKVNFKNLRSILRILLNFHQRLSTETSVKCQPIQSNI